MPPKIKSPQFASWLSQRPSGLFAGKARVWCKSTYFWMPFEHRVQASKTAAGWEGTGGGASARTLRGSAAAARRRCCTSGRAPAPDEFAESHLRNRRTPHWSWMSADNGSVQRLGETKASWHESRSAKPTPGGRYSNFGEQKFLLLLLIFFMISSLKGTRFKRHVSQREINVFLANSLSMAGM